MLTTLLLPHDHGLLTQLVKENRGSDENGKEKNGRTENEVGVKERFKKKLVRNRSRLKWAGYVTRI